MDKVEVAMDLDDVASRDDATLLFCTKLPIRKERHAVVFCPFAQQRFGAGFSGS